uniref:C-C motif chemokine 20-like n=1 Tax=Echeneis naucrates TaxID=173247 RepID=A0A665X582_ECHNA
MATSKACLVAALCSLIIISAFIDGTQSGDCCLRYTRKKWTCRQLLGYSIQNINTSCDISATIFHLPERFVCADPSMKWVQKVMACLDITVSYSKSSH